mmetsp:Transcript_9545/g.9194  ORF Transcript_9545/g.9194 Transcript_9545/m.9194 type:complete len:95 (+) Transcript_9545:313-597(+)
MRKYTIHEYRMYEIDNQPALTLETTKYIRPSLVVPIDRQEDDRRYSVENFVQTFIQEVGNDSKILGEFEITSHNYYRGEITIRNTLKKRMRIRG